MGRKRKAKPFRYLVRDRGSDGKLRLYYREPERPRVRIHVGEDHPDFPAHFAAAKAGDPLPSPSADAPKPRVKPGTLEDLVRSYSKSAAFMMVRPNGRRAVLGILESCCAEIWPENKKPMGSLPLSRVADRHIQFLQDQKAGLPGGANNRVKYLRILFNWGKVRPNPANDVKMLPPKRKHGHHAWTLAEIAQYETRHPVGTTARLALDLALFTAARRADVAKMGPANLTIDESDGTAWLGFVQGKTEGAVEVPVLEPLALSIAATRTGDKTFLITSYGKPYTAAGFGNAFQAWRDEAGLSKECAMHGLRKAAASKLAVLGCSEPEIQAVTGHATSEEVQRYIKSASRRTMAGSAMAKLRESLKAKPKTLLIAGPSR